VIHATHYNHCRLEAASAYGMIKRFGSFESTREIDRIELDWKKAPLPGSELWRDWKHTFFDRLESFRDTATTDPVKVGSF